MTLQEIKPLILRSNRFLGTSLVERKLISVEQLETANEKLLENIQNNDVRRANILHILLFEMQILNEDLYLESVVERHGLGLVDLHGCTFRKLADLKPDLTACWATWTVPFDMVDDFCLLATGFYPSQPAVKFWEEKYAGSNVLWYATSVRSLHGALEKIEQAASAAKAATKPPVPRPASGSKPPQPAAAAAVTAAAAAAATAPAPATGRTPVPKLSLGRGAEAKPNTAHPLKAK